QAEDGIRGFHVTGVQTCALPICGCRSSSWAALGRPEVRRRKNFVKRSSSRGGIPFVQPQTARRNALCLGARGRLRGAQRAALNRSEERRVGKEGRARGAGDDRKR